MFLVLRAKRREILTWALERIKVYTISFTHQKRSRQRKSLRIILKVLLKNKRSCFDALYWSSASI
jgi:hypothetical protein